MRLILFVISLSFSTISYSQEKKQDSGNPITEKLKFGIQAGTGWAYEDEAHLFNTSTAITLDYHLKNQFYIQFAPAYTWLWKWNEHYLTLPVHLRKKFGDKFSLLAGPALSFDMSSFRDMGVSAGAYYHLTPTSSLVFYAFTFTLYDYHIDYFYAPISILYRFSL